MEEKIKAIVDAGNSSGRAGDASFIVKDALRKMQNDSASLQNDNFQYSAPR